jgi:hypothetical protein
VEKTLAAIVVAPAGSAAVPVLEPPRGGWRCCCWDEFLAAGSM